MKLLVTPTVQKLDLAEWNDSFKGQSLHVWVDPPRALLEERKSYSQMYWDFLKSNAVPEGQAEMQEQAKSRQEREEAFLKDWNPMKWAFFARLWSQGPQETHWELAELIELDQSNPRLLQWMIARSNEMLDNYRGAEKKA
jgi:hypothetical protein